MAREALQTEIGFGTDHWASKAMEHEVMTYGRLHGDGDWGNRSSGDALGVESKLILGWSHQNGGGSGSADSS